MSDITIEVIRVDDPFRRPEHTINERGKVIDLKEDIESLHDIPADQQIILYYSQILEDNKSFKSYGIRDGSKLQLLIRTEGAMQISYQNGTKKGYLQVRPRETIQVVKNRLAQQEKLDPNRFYIKLGQTRLNENWTVGTSNIKSNNEVICVMN